MNDVVWQGILRHIQPLSGFEKAKLIEVTPGYCKYSIEVQPTMINLYGNLHGGVIFTLCDIAAGMATYAYEVSNVTLQGNINFEKAVQSGTLYVECKTEHKGRQTAVNCVHITDEAGRNIASAMMTMFIVGPLEV